MVLFENRVRRLGFLCLLLKTESVGKVSSMVFS